MICTEADLYAITHKRRPSAQAKALRAMGIEHRQRTDNTVLVLKSHVEHLLNPGQRTTVKRREPNWKALDAPTPKASEQGTA